MNERTVAPTCAAPAHVLAAAFKQAIPDWQERSGVEPKQVVLAVDADTDAATVQALLRAAHAARSWQVRGLVLDAQGAVLQVVLALPD